MKYEMEELIPLVGWLAQKYTSGESTSVTYEKAEQLMEAVLYCIREAERETEYAVAAPERMTAEKIYHIGAEAVERKTKTALKLYHQILPEFHSYENQCLQDTMTKGIPEFFKWYDVRFAPQETILTLDYPVLKDLSAYTGIDCIFQWLVCIQYEQRFLRLFPESNIISILLRYDEEYRENIINLAEIFLFHFAGHLFAEKPFTGQQFDKTDYNKIKTVFQNESREDLKKEFKLALKLFLKGAGEEEPEMLTYLATASEEILVRMENASQNEKLEVLF